jgi:hypothetical protein
MLAGGIEPADASVREQRQIDGHGALRGAGGVPIMNRTIARDPDADHRPNG